MMFQEKRKNTRSMVWTLLVATLTVIMTALVIFSPKAPATMAILPSLDNQEGNIEVAVAYVNTHNADLVAHDAQLSYGGTQHTIHSHDAIDQFNSALYRSGGVILGVDTLVQQVTALSDTVIMVEYTYTGTAFYGDVYPLETMVDYETITVPLVSIYQIIDGVIVSEITLDANTPLPLALTLEN